MNAPQKKDDEDPRIQLIHMALKGPTSCTGLLINLFCLIVVVPLGVIGVGLFFGALGLPPELGLLAVPAIAFFLWRMWTQR